MSSSPSPNLDPYKQLALEHKFAVRYAFVNYTDKAAETDAQIFVQQPRILPPAELQNFTRLLDQRRAAAAWLHATPDAADKDGILGGACWLCPFTQICSLDSADREQAAIEAWPNKGPYDPTHMND